MGSKSYSKGISWIDDCRIPFVDGDKTVNHNTVPGSFVGSVGYSEKIYHENTTGRFPANLLVSDDMLNDGSIGKGSGIEKMTVNNHSQTESKYQYSKVKKQFSIADKGTNSRYYDIDRWFNNLIDV
jgi:hypothetical protein